MNEGKCIGYILQSLQNSVREYSRIYCLRSLKCQNHKDIVPLWRLNILLQKVFGFFRYNNILAHVELVPKGFTLEWMKRIIVAINISRIYYLISTNQDALLTIPHKIKPLYDI